MNNRLRIVAAVSVLALSVMAGLGIAQNPATIDPSQLDGSCCTLEAAQANQLQSSKVMVDRLNANLKTIYLGAFNNWKISVDAGRVSNANPPQPPKAYVVSAPDAAGFQWPVIGKDPVCDMPPLPDDHFTPAVKVPNTVDVGKSIGGKWYAVGPKDTLAPGAMTPPIPDSFGTPHVYEKYAAPVGAGWYLQVN